MRITLPWAVVLPDNRRTGVLHGRALLTREYRQRKHAAALVAMSQHRGAPLLGPVQLVARVHFPDRRRRDAGNYRKLVTDALTAVVYQDDVQIHDERWIRAEIDPVNPRIELTITPLVEEAA